MQVHGLVLPYFYVVVENRMNWETAARLWWSCRVRWLCCAVCALAGHHMSQSHDYSPVTPAYTSGQPSSVSDAVTVADMSSTVIGLSVTVAVIIVIYICHNCQR